MASVPLADLLVNIVLENKEAIAALKAFETARDKALNSGNKSGLQADFEKLAATVKETNRVLDPLTSTTKLLATQQSNLSTAIKAGVVPAGQAVKAYRDLETAYKSQLVTLTKGTASYKEVAASMKAAGSEAQRLEGLVKGANAAYKADDLTRYSKGLGDIVTAQKAGVISQNQAIGQLRSYQSALAQQTGSLEKNGAEQKTVAKVIDDVSAAIKRLTGELRDNEIGDFVTRLKAIETAQRANILTADQAANAVVKLQAEYKTYTANLGLTERELGLLSTGQRDAATTATTLGTAQERALKAFDSTALRQFAGELTTLVREQRDSGTAFDDTARRVTELQGRLREYGSTLKDGSQEQADLNRVLELSQRVLQDVGTAAGRAQEGFEGSGVRNFTSDVESAERSLSGVESNLNTLEGELSQLSGSFKGSGDAARTAAGDYGTFENTARTVDGSLSGIEAELLQLSGSLKETGNSANLSARELDALARVNTSLIGATERLAGVQERASNSLQSENIRQQVAALNDLKLALERGEISQEQFVVSAREIGSALDQARAGLEQNTRGFSGYTGALTKVESSLAQAEGRVRTFGISSGVAAGISDQLSSVLYRFGPAGEAAATAMYAVGAGMEGASVGAKALNIALTVGLVGSLVGAAVAAGTVVKAMFGLDTGLTDVQKSTGFTNDQLNDLAKGLQDVSVATGTPTQDLIELAAVAGQMGVTGVDNVLKFTEVINKLAIATNITGEEGAQQLSNFINVTKEAGQSTSDSADLVANILVALGNSVAGGEAAILSMAQRLGVLKSASSLSQTDILGLAGGFVDLGLTAERAETSVTSTFTAISQAASQGGEKLNTFAQASGLTATEFKNLAESSPTDAFLALIGGLRQAQDAGQDLNPVLDKLAGGNTTLRNVLLTLVGGYDSVSKAINTAREESVTMSAAQNELGSRLDSLRGITNQITTVFGYLRDSLALRLTPALQETLTGTLDFIRAAAGFEQAGSGVISSASTMGTNIRDFTIALFGLGSVTDSVGGQLGEKLGGAIQDVNSFFEPLANNLNTVQASFNNAGQETRLFILDLLGIKTATGEGVNASNELAGSLDNAASSTLTLGSAQEELARALDVALNAQKGIFNLTAQEAQAYYDRLIQVRDAYPELASQLQPLINQTGSYLETLGKSGDVATETAAKTFDLAQAQQTYADLQRLALPQAQMYLDNLLALKKANPEAAASLNPLITGTQLYIKTLGDADTASEVSANSLEGLRAKRQELVDQYNKAEIGSAAQAEALAAIRAVDGQIESYDQLGAKQAEVARTAGDMADNIAASFQAGQISAGTAIDALKTKLDELKQQKADALASGDYDPADLVQLDTDIATVQARLTEAQTAAANFRDGVTSYDEAQRTANKSIQDVNTIFEQQRVLIEKLNWDGAAQNVNLYADAQDAAEAKIRANSEAAFAQETSQRDLNKSIQDSVVVFREQNAVLEQLALAQATQETNDLAAAQAALLKSSQDSIDSWRTLKETQDGYASSTNLTVSQTQTLSTVMGTVRNALQEAENAYKVTGDAVGFNADKAEIYKSALETLARAGIDPATVGLGEYVTKLQDASEGVKVAEEGAKRYQESLQATRDAQEALNDGIAANEIDGYIDSLQEAATGTGLLGQQARDTIQDLQNLKLTYQGLETLSSIARNLSDSFDTTGAQSQLDDLNKKKDELLESGDYDGKDLDALNEDIAELQGNIQNTELLGGVFEGIADSADALFEAMENGASASEQLFAGLAAGLGAFGDALGQTDDLMGTFLKNSAGALQSLAGGDFVGFVGGVVNSIVGIFKSNADEVAQYEAIVRQSGVKVAEEFSEMTANGIQVNEVAYVEWRKAEEQRAEQHVKFMQEWVEREQKRNEDIAKANQELVRLTQDANATLNSLNNDTQDARVKFYESTHSGKEADRNTFIAETILTFREQSAEFNSEMQRITQEKNEYISTYLAAHPGAGRAEANAAAEAIFGPQRESLKESFALTSATILASAAQSAKDLGLSQQEFYQAVFEGNTEVLGNMTEGQRQAIIQFVDLAHELGIELPKALEEAYGNVNEKWNDAGAELAEGQKNAAQATADRIQGEIDELGSAWDKRSAFLKDKIATSTGETKAMYEEMLRVEGEAYTKAVNDKTAAMNEASSQANAKTIEQLQTDRDNLKTEYDKNQAEITEALKTATGAERDALLQRQTELYDAYLAASGKITEAINEGNDGVGSALESNAQATVSMIEEDIRTLNTAWANRSAELQNLIANSSGAAKAAYEEQYRVESAAYETSRQDLQDDLVDANGKLLDAQDKGSDDFVAAQEEITKKETAALGGIYEQLRAILGPEADLIIGMIQNTYDRRRATYVASGTETATAAEQANQGEIETLGSIFEQLRALLGPEADLIISMIQSTYDKRASAYGTGGAEAANTAEASFKSEQQSMANINQALRDLFGPEAESIIAQIKAMFNKRAESYKSGGAETSSQAKASADSEQQVMANINQALRDLFGPEAEGIITQIKAMFNGRKDAYKAGGEENAGAASDSADAEAGAVNDGTDKVAGSVDNSTSVTTQAIENRSATIESFLARGDVTPALRTSLEAFNKAIADGGNLTQAEIQANRDKVTDAINDRGEKIRNLVENGVPLAEAVRRVDEELARTLDATSADISRSASEGGTLAAQGIDSGKDKQLTAIEALKAGLTQGVGGLTQQVTPKIAEEHRAMMQAFIDGAKTSEGGISTAERAQITAMGLYQRQLDTNVANIGSGVAPAVITAHNLIGTSFTQSGQTVASNASTALTAITGGVSEYDKLSPLVSGIFGGVSTTVNTQGGAVAGSFTTQSGAIVNAVQGGFNGASSTLQTQGSGFANTVQGVFNGISSGVTSGYGDSVTAFQQGSGRSVDAIQAAYNQEQERFKSESGRLVDAIQNAKGAERDRLIAEYQNLQREHEAKSRDYVSQIDNATNDAVGAYGDTGTRTSSAVDTAFKAIIGSQTGGSNTLINTLTSSFGTVGRTIDTGYNATVQGYNDGGNKSEAAIQAAYKAEQDKFRTQSQALETAIANAKGDERDKLIAEYDAMKREHETKSKMYQEQIARSSGLESGKLNSSAGDLVKAIGGFGTDGSRKTKDVYDDLIGDWKKKSGDYTDTIGGVKDDFSKALDAVSKVIKDFKFPALPTPPKVPKIPGITGDAGDTPSISPVSFTAPSIGAYAADGLPDYTSATSQVYAYAAATGGLLDLFGDNRALTLNATTQRDLALTVSFSGFKDVFSAPASLMDKASGLMWKTAQFERDTALINRETAELLGKKTKTSSYDLARTQLRKRKE